ncbi:MAG: hypothetical protein ACM3WV_01305 [Bacillota bacterium]
MGFQIFKTKPITVKPNEEVDLTPIVLTKENRGVIHGTVLCPDGKPAKGAVVKLLKVIKDSDCAEDGDKCRFKPVGHQFTDCCGQFLFPIKDTGATYVIKATLFKPKNRLFKVDDDCQDTDTCDDPCDP